MARLYADENFPKPVVEGLRALGHDVITLQETARVGSRCPTTSSLQDAGAGLRAATSTPADRGRGSMLALRVEKLGVDRVLDVQYELAPDALAAWLTNRAAT
jgi:hypothetical protein